MNTLRALEKFPGHFVGYLWGLLGAMLDDYALITLVIFVVLLGFAVGSALIATAAFFGAYFLLRLVINVAEAIGYHAYVTARAQTQPGVVADSYNPPDPIAQ